MPIQMLDLEENWRGRRGYACLFWPKGNTRFFAWPDQLDELREVAQEVNRQGDVYVGWCLFSQESRLAEHASVVPGVLLDVDLNTGRHAAKNYPDSEEEALRLLAQSPLPLPSRVIRSGGGLYVHYLFEEPFEARTDQDRERVAAVLKGVYRMVQGSFASAGRKLDNVSDLARITRPVGASNHKYGPNVVIQLAEESSVRYRLEDLEALIGSGSNTLGSRKAVTPGDNDDEGKGLFELVERHCGFIGGMADRPTEVTEPEWYAAATIAAHCEDGEERFHELSARDTRRYDEGQAAKKYRHARTVKPRTCDSIEVDLGCDACKRCPFKAADIRSPYALAFGDPKILQLQEEYVLSGDTDQYHCIVRDEPSLASRSFDNQFAHIVPNPHSRFTRDRRSPKVKLVDYVPGEPRLIIDQRGTLVLNSWCEGGVSPVVGDCDVIIDHLSYLLPLEEDRKWLLDYLAHLIQKPGVKIASSITLIGGQGVGKSFISKLIERLFGASNVFVDDAALHASDYKQSLGNRQVLIIEEMATAQKWEVSNSIKPWITADKVIASEKYVRAHEVRTPRGILVFTNHAVPAVLERDDRRNAIIRIDAAPREQTYYDRLWDFGLAQAACFKNWLLGRNISTWSPNARPPMTEAKQEIILSSRTPAAMEIEELVLSKGRQLIMVEEIMIWLNPFMLAQRFNMKQVRGAMHELGYRKLNKTKLSNGRAVDLWSTTDHSAWLEADHATRKAYYEGRSTATGTMLGIVSPTLSSASSNSVPGNL